MGPVATAVNAKFAACSSNFVILEYKSDDTSPRRDMVQEPLKLKDGYLELPHGPGLGVELNEEYLVQHPSTGWRRQLPIRPDGSLAFV